MWALISSMYLTCMCWVRAYYFIYDTDLTTVHLAALQKLKIGGINLLWEGNSNSGEILAGNKHVNKYSRVSPS